MKNVLNGHLKFLKEPCDNKIITTVTAIPQPCKRLLHQPMVDF